MVVDLRADTSGDMQEVERRLRALRPILPGAKIEVRGGFSRPPLAHEASANLFQNACRLAELWDCPSAKPRRAAARTATSPRRSAFRRSTDSGAVGEGAHSSNENVILRGLPERAALLAGLLATL